MRNLKNKVCLMVLVLVLSPLMILRPAFATGIPVVDVANLLQAVQDAINQGTQIANQATQIQNQIQLIQNQVRSLQTLGSDNFNQLDNNFNQQLFELQSVLSAAQKLGFSLNGVQSQFDALFPAGSDWESIDAAQFKDFYKDWNESISEAAKVAIQAQSNIDQIQRHNATAQSILSSVQGADGKVRQLQANNQLLSVMSQQMSGLNQSMATSGRVAATMAAKSAAQEESERMASERARLNYTNMGAPVAVPSSLPGR